MLKELLEEVVVIVAGKQAEPISDLLNTKKHINEFIIAKKLDLTINQTRNILYKISDYGLVSSIRKKDKKKGWYTYFWKIEILKTLEFLKLYLEKKMEQLNSQISSRETRTFYVCERCGLEFNEENAMHQEFACPECGEILSLKDNTKLIKELKKNYDKLKVKLGEIKLEIESENARIEKEREKENKKKKIELDNKKALKKKIAQKNSLKKSPKKTEKKSFKKIIKKKIIKRKNAKKKIVKKIKSRKK